MIEPRFVDNDKFGLIGYLTKKEIEFNHLLDLADMGKRQATSQAKTLDLIEGILV
jgi:16S rRNA G527 N7-methylase RsmG